MTNVFGEHITHATEVPLSKLQGRSQKTLRRVVTYQGGIYLARFEGRKDKFFGKTPQEATANLKVGGAA